MPDWPDWSDVKVALLLGATVATVLLAAWAAPALIGDRSPCALHEVYNATTETCEPWQEGFNESDLEDATPACTTWYNCGLLPVFTLLAAAVLLLGLVALILRRFAPPYDQDPPEEDDET